MNPKSSVKQAPRDPKLQEALEMLREVISQADEDCPGEYRTKHFRAALKDGISLLKRYKEW